MFYIYGVKNIISNTFVNDKLLNIFKVLKFTILFKVKKKYLLQI